MDELLRAYQQQVQNDRKTVTLYPYRSGERWFFDVEKGEGREACPLGIDEIVDELTASFESSGGVALTISARRTSHEDLELRALGVSDVLGWRLYQSAATRTLGFASPELLGWFSDSPSKLFLSVGAIDAP